jgi:glycosyltransferase involved in cell wall biosynthesis
VKISIIIPAFNEEKLLPGTLASLQVASHSFAKRGWETEIIVCDNNSTDRTAELARAGGAQVVFEPVNQMSRARNSAAAAATGDWFIFVDADSRPSAELLDEVAIQIAHGKCLAGGATVRPDEKSFLSWLVFTFAWSSLSRWRRWCTGPFIFCDAAAFRELGGFNLKLYTSEDVDFSLRLRPLAQKTGRKIIILTRHPIITSARKLHLYQRRAYFLFFLKSIFTGGKTMANKADCQTWYDGKR